MTKEQAVKHNRQATHDLIEYKTAKKVVVIAGIIFGLAGALTIWSAKNILENA